MAKFIATRGLDRAGALAQVTKGFIPLMFWENLLTESQSLSDITGRQSDRNSIQEEALGLSDAISRLQSIIRTSSENEGLSDSLSFIVPAVRLLTENLGVKTN